MHWTQHDQALLHCASSPSHSSRQRIRRERLLLQMPTGDYSRRYTILLHKPPHALFFWFRINPDWIERLIKTTISIPPFFKFLVIHLLTKSLST